MNRTRLVLGIVAATVAGAVTGTVVARGQERARTEPEALSDPAASQPMDMGVGEDVLLVVGGTFETRVEAEEANAGISFGDVQGFYVAKTSQFDGLRAQLGASARDFVLVSAFRTEAGAREFLELASAVGAPAMLTSPVRNAGGEYVGLGQEANPDGSGPLTAA